MNLCIIQAHMASSRLPGKVMKKLCGKEVLYHVYSRCKKAKSIDEVVIATSTNSENDRIEQFCIENNIECFRGSENDVLDRFYQCAKQYDAEIIARVTSDCPLLEPKLLDYWVENLENDKIEFVQEESGMYLGFGLDVFSMDALEKLKQKSYKDKQKEHVIGYYLDHPQEFRSKVYPMPKDLEYIYRDYRLTMDTDNDYEIIKHLYDKFYNEGIVNLKQVMHYLDNNQSILNINKEILQKNYYEQDE